MKLKTIIAAVLFLAIALHFFNFNSDATTKTGYKWNDISYASGPPVMSIDMLRLDSSTSNMSEYDNGYFAQFHAKTITMGYLYKAPVTDSARVIIYAKISSLIYYPVDTQIIIGAASYTYVPKSVNLSLSGYGKDYAVWYETYSDSTRTNRANDSLYLTFTPSEVNYVPTDWNTFYQR